MKIAFVITGLGVGGAEKVVVSLAEALADRGHDVIIVYLKGPAILRPSNPSIELVSLGLESTRDLLRGFSALGSILRNFGPDIVHSHLVHANILMRLMRLSIHIPKLITTAHNKNEEGIFRMLAYRLTDQWADISTNVSDEAVSAFVKQKAVKNGRMITVHNGISLNEFNYRASAGSQIRNEFGIHPGTKIIVAVGRLSDPKDYPNLLTALSKLKPETPQYQVLIAGDGPLGADLRAMTTTLGLNDRVRFLGIRRDVPQLLSAAELFVLSSAWEGFPMVVGEAMACECTVVATDCGGVKEFVGDAGLLVPPKNADTLARRIEIALAMTDEERSRFGKAARERVQQLYSLDTAVEKWLALYQNTSK